LRSRGGEKKREGHARTQLIGRAGKHGGSERERKDGIAAGKRRKRGVPFSIRFLSVKRGGGKKRREGSLFTFDQVKEWEGEKGKKKQS